MGRPSRSDGPANARTKVCLTEKEHADFAAAAKSATLCCCWSKSLGMRSPYRRPPMPHAEEENGCRYEFWSPEVSLNSL